MTGVVLNRSEQGSQYNFNVAQSIMSLSNFKTMSDTEEIFVYREGVYRNEGETLIKVLAQRIMGNRATIHRINEVIAIIRRSTLISRDQFDNQPNLLNLKNALYDFDSDSLLSHTPEVLTTVQLPITFSPDSKPVKITEFMAQVIKPSDRKVIEEMFGSFLLKDYKNQKVFIFYGKGANGKSVMLQLICALLGNENVSSVPLQDIDNNRFAAADLYGKMANVCGDLSDAELIETGRFKMLTGSDLVTGEKKFHQPFKFKNYAKMIFSANKLPESRDRSDAFFRRLAPIEFPNRFEGKSADRNLLEKLTTPEELEGLFNLALAGRKRLLEQDGFSLPTTDEIRMLYEGESSPIAKFIFESMIQDVEGRVIKSELYKVYRAYCKKHHFNILPSNAFGRKIKELIPDVFDCRVGRKTALAGIKLRSLP